MHGRMSAHIPVTRIIFFTGLQNGDTALKLAIDQQNPELVSLLIENSVDTSYRNKVTQGQ